jgi:uncharacterized cupredoxin-like copper-binding protein
MDRQEGRSMSKRTRGIAIAAAVVVLSMLAAACGGDGGDSGDNKEGANAAPASFAVSLSEFALSPDMIHAPAGRELSFDVSNDGSAPHTFAVDTGNGVKATRELQPGETQTLVVPALDAGEYRISCTISGHADLGMVGSLMVATGTDIAAGTGSSGATGATGHAGMSVQDMLDGHRAGVEAFPRTPRVRGISRSSRGSRTASRCSSSPSKRSSGRPSPARSSRRWASTGRFRVPRSA